MLDVSKRFHQWQALLSRHDHATLIRLLQEAPMVDVADFLQKQELPACVRLLALFDIQAQATLFSHFVETRQLDLYHALPRRVLATIFTHMPSDLRVDFYQKLDDRQQAYLLPYLPKKVKQDVITLSAYLPETAGGIMSTDFATVHHEMTIQQALDKIREDAPSKKMIYYLYVVNEDMKMIGFISLKDMIMIKPQAFIKEILKETFVFARVSEDKESVAQKIEKYNLAALPVLNDDEQLVGIVSYDDAIDVIRAEHTEDMERFMGIVSDDQSEDYLKTSSTQHFQKRIGWVASLFVFSFLSGYIMRMHQGLLEKFAVLALYMTTINDAGGNTGSQAATVVVRALALRQVLLKDWLIILFKELKVALMSMIVLALLTFVKVIVLSSDSVTHLYKIAFIITISVSLQVLTATLIGATLPLLVYWLGKDPALAASPAITTIVDITGMVIYFTTAALFLG